MWSYRHKWCWMLRSSKFGSCPENTKKLHKLVLVDCKLKFHEIAEQLISEGSIFTILHDHLSRRKLYSKWVQCLRMINQDQQHVNNSEHCLQLFQHNKKEFLHKFATMDETQIHHFILESNQQSAEWTAAGFCWLIDYLEKWLVVWVLWHINLCRLFNAKSFFFFNK